MPSTTLLTVSYFGLPLTDEDVRLVAVGRKTQHCLPIPFYPGRDEGCTFLEMRNDGHYLQAVFEVPDGNRTPFMGRDYSITSRNNSDQYGAWSPFSRTGRQMHIQETHFIEWHAQEGDGQEHRRIYYRAGHCFRRMNDLDYRPNGEDIRYADEGARPAFLQGRHWRARTRLPGYLARYRVEIRTVQALRWLELSAEDIKANGYADHRAFGNYWFGEYGKKIGYPENPWLWQSNFTLIR